MTKWDQCSLPVALGGLGIRSASSLSLPAFLSSGHACQSAISKVLLTHLGEEYKPLDEAESIWLKEMNGESEFPLVLSEQKAWDNPICKRKLNSLISETATEKD